MEIKDSWWPGADYKLKFNRLDKEVIRAMVREAGSNGADEKRDAYSYTLLRRLGKIAFSRNRRVLYLKKDDLHRLADELDNFAARYSNDPSPDSPDSDSISPIDVGRRIRRGPNGSYASMLAGEIDHFRLANMSLPELDEEVSGFLDDYQAGDG